MKKSKKSFYYFLAGLAIGAAYLPTLIFGG